MLDSNLATGQGESCDTCHRVVYGYLAAAAAVVQLPLALALITQSAASTTSRFSFDKLIVWLNCNLLQLRAQLSRALSPNPDAFVGYQPKLMHKLACIALRSSGNGHAPQTAGRGSA